MNRDDIIRMAREACDPETVDAWHNGYWTLTQDELERFAALVAAAEREACARVPEEISRRYAGAWNSVLYECAAAIRARGEG